ncbi:MAG: hypothetical protein HY221_00565, partial [Candidatus Sungbacteria bacterium]|nr:hypothetical protein [Candidatus Sungbacteria bacterium]
MNQILPTLTEAQITEVITKIGLRSSRPTTKISVGFSNEVFSIGDEYILKAIKETDDALNLK